MKKLIFRKFAKDVFQFFLLLSISFSLIVWVIQAVNYLDIVTEDGHGFKVYFLYTLLSLPKIFSKILPFIYFVSLFYIILKYENENELIIFWTIGIKKIDFVKVLLKFSFFYLMLQLIFTTYFVPMSLDKARSYIRSSNVDLFSSLIQEKKFIDAVKNLTIFVEKKDRNGNLKNIFLKERIGKKEYQTIIAKEGKLIKSNSKSSLILFDGKIINNNDQTINSFKFTKTEINLSRFGTNTTTYPKIQEVKSYDILTCIIKLKNINNNFISNFFKNDKLLKNCIPENLDDTFQEIFKRFISPLYLITLSLIACLIIIKSKDDYEYFKYKFILFILGVFAIIISETSIKYSSENTFNNFYILSLPLLLVIAIYLYLNTKLKKTNLINQ
tara:strand:- start:342 stop:1496 length:1155 start_codon:yes stop_codon:yes gene_type:complete